MHKTIVLGLLFLVVIAESQVPSSSISLGGVSSPYSSVIAKLVDSFKPSGKKFDPGLVENASIKLTCYETPENPFYIGMLQEMEIHASLSQVSSILDDFEHYKDLFVDFKDIHVVSREKNLILTFWEQKSPMFFIPNIKYQMTYRITVPHPLTRVYHYQLKESGKLKFDDGVIFLEQIEPGVTKLSEYDFWDADWGILKSTMPGKIWPENVKGNLLSNLAVQAKAEHPEWDYKKIRNESEKSLKLIKWEAALEHKSKFSK